MNVEQTKPSQRAALQDGFAIAFLNPKLAVFFLALFSQFIDPENLTLQGWFNHVLNRICTGYWLVSVGCTVHRNIKKAFWFYQDKSMARKIARHDLYRLSCSCRYNSINPSILLLYSLIKRRVIAASPRKRIVHTYSLHNIYLLVTLYWLFFDNNNNHKYNTSNDNRVEIQWGNSS